MRRRTPRSGTDRLASAQHRVAPPDGRPSETPAEQTELQNEKLFSLSSFCSRRDGVEFFLWHIVALKKSPVSLSFSIKPIYGWTEKDRQRHQFFLGFRTSKKKNGTLTLAVGTLLSLCPYIFHVFLS